MLCKIKELRVNKKGVVNDREKLAHNYGYITCHSLSLKVFICVLFLNTWNDIYQFETDKY